MRHLQLLRNATLFTTREDALTTWESAAFKEKIADGEFFVARYKDGTSTYILEGHCVEDANGVKSIVTQDFKSIEDAIKSLRNQIGEINAESLKVVDTAEKFSATTVESVLVELDDKITTIGSQALGIEEGNAINFETKADGTIVINGAYQAGEGINISGDTISCTLDTTLYVLVEQLPSSGAENKIYLVKSESSGDTNVYSEYIYANGLWEKLGEYKASIDLTAYLSKSEAEGMYALKNDVPKVYFYDLATTSISQEEVDKMFSSNLIVVKDGAEYYTSTAIIPEAKVVEASKQTVSGGSNVKPNSVYTKVLTLTFMLGDGADYVCDYSTSAIDVSQVYSFGHTFAVSGGTISQTEWNDVNRSAAVYWGVSASQTYLGSISKTLDETNNVTSLSIGGYDSLSVVNGVLIFRVLTIKSDLSYTVTTKAYNVPTKTSQLTNDSDFTTNAYVRMKIEELTAVVSDNEEVAASTLTKLNASCGFNENCEFTPSSDAHFIGESTTITEALNVIDSRLKSIDCGEY